MSKNSLNYPNHSTRRSFSRKITFKKKRSKIFSMTLFLKISSELPQHPCMSKLTHRVSFQLKITKNSYIIKLDQIHDKTMQTAYSDVQTVTIHFVQMLVRMDLRKMRTIKSVATHCMKNFKLVFWDVLGIRCVTISVH